MTSSGSSSSPQRGDQSSWFLLSLSMLALRQLPRVARLVTRQRDHRSITSAMAASSPLVHWDSKTCPYAQAS